MSSGEREAGDRRRYPKTIIPTQEDFVRCVYLRLNFTMLIPAVNGGR